MLFIRVKWVYLKARAGDVTIVRPSVMGGARPIKTGAKEWIRSERSEGKQLNRTHSSTDL